ncbi:hypothetical protein DFR41_104196 [Pseudacidovorax intermedius]|uniref:Metal-binding protein n=1 Tax=Pseudacidovorax intermedius TaxID=433924 RepID=A0A370FFZ8_9BURK|nr:DUF411 domain-containing protein [Pseudacidovorax intermedius]RDI25140.1 hypothetical protein DFR41_104196 [Pseudacidovorax intermedius]
MQSSSSSSIASPRRRLLLTALPLTALPIAGTAVAAAPRVDVWKDPNCGCCVDWVKHLNANGFATRVHEEGNARVRQEAGIPRTLGSCHTASVGGYAIEGHVPARDIHRLLREKPAGAIGLAVPGMPIGSPGMDGPAYGDRRDAYDVLLVLAAGGTRVFQRYR